MITSTREVSRRVQNHDWSTAGIVAITAVAALLRFPTLGTQSYWFDEIVTVGLVNLSAGEMLSTIPDSETTPPLYYLLAWLWAQPFGTGELGLRSLSALFGVAMIPVVYLALKELVSRRVGLVAAALAAVNPFLIWYSQEARSYALLALLGAVSLLFFLRALDSPSKGSVAWWAVSSALALATHYFAAFLVGAEALLLLAAHRRRSAVRWASIALIAVGASLLPLAIHQWGLGYASNIAGQSLTERIRSTPGSFVFNSIASTDSFLVVMKVLSAGLVVLGLVLFVAYARDRERAGGIVLLSVGLLALVASVAMDALGIEAITAKNLIVLWLPLAGVVAIGFGARNAGPLGPAAAAILCAIGAGVVLVTASSREHQRDVWREAAADLDRLQGPRALVAVPGYADTVLGHYGLDVERMPASGADLAQIDVLYRPLSNELPANVGHPSESSRLSLFQITEIDRFQRFMLVRLNATRTVRVTPSDLRALPTELFKYHIPTPSSGQSPPSLPPGVPSSFDTAPFAGLLPEP